MLCSENAPTSLLIINVSTTYNVDDQRQWTLHISNQISSGQGVLDLDKI